MDTVRIKNVPVQVNLPGAFLRKSNIGGSKVLVALTNLFLTLAGIVTLLNGVLSLVEKILDLLERD